MRVNVRHGGRVGERIGSDPGTAPGPTLHHGQRPRVRDRDTRGENHRNLRDSTSSGSPGPTELTKDQLSPTQHLEHQPDTHHPKGNTDIVEKNAHRLIAAGFVAASSLIAAPPRGMQSIIWLAVGA